MIANVVRVEKFNAVIVGSSTEQQLSKLRWLKITSMSLLLEDFKQLLNYPFNPRNPEPIEISYEYSGSALFSWKRVSSDSVEVFNGSTSKIFSSNKLNFLDLAVFIDTATLSELVTHRL